MFTQKDFNMQKRWWIELINDYDCEIIYNVGKANVVADDLSGKELETRIKGRSMRIKLIFTLLEQIKAAQIEVMKEENKK